ncbi:hypothetical protein B9Z55_027660 [Caenorhabditis nigoni]|uniref:Uncharacterized protein n=1 Tax=Caenorhabditis nigoni TaxID=1611254 RepID=A0A2G5SF49_9PELO|nr:hypothetical protein B9Z55_027660 [Caenorhabditis nigoni]
MLEKMVSNEDDVGKYDVPRPTFLYFLHKIEIGPLLPTGFQNSFGEIRQLQTSERHSADMVMTHHLCERRIKQLHFLSQGYPKWNELESTEKEEWTKVWRVLERNRNDSGRLD